MKALLLLFMVCVANCILADQLQLNSLSDCKKAWEQIAPNSILISYCSSCDGQKVEIWLVKKTSIEPQDRGCFQVVVFAKRLFQSEQTINHGHYVEPIRYENVAVTNADDLWIAREVDLAYIYSPAEKGAFCCLWKLLNLPCDVPVEKIKLPEDIQRMANKAADDAAQKAD